MNLFGKQFRHTPGFTALLALLLAAAIAFFVPSVLLRGAEQTHS